MEAYKESALSLGYENLPESFNGWGFKSTNACISFLWQHETRSGRTEEGRTSCRGTWDTVLCWPSAVAGATVRLPCPPLRGLDATKYAYRSCSPTGEWQGSDRNGKGGTNYLDCYSPDSKLLIDRFFNKSSSVESLKSVAYGAKVLELTGLSLSLLALSVSVVVFSYFRSLRCHRTRIHRHLCVAILIHVTVQLVVNVDRLIALAADSQLGGGALAVGSGTIYATATLCEALHVLVEYTKTVMFAWMFIEGFYLHKTLVVSVFSTAPNYLLYYAIGWGFPLLLTVPWAVASAYRSSNQFCWFTYTFQAQYWILEGPRLAIICINLFFLLRIVGELIRKLRQNDSSEALQVWKCVRAAVILLPLLGANNFLVMIEPKTDSFVKFALWSYAATFLISFQGFFISLFYCFLNADVQHTLIKCWTRRGIRCRIPEGTSSVSRRGAASDAGTKDLTMQQRHHTPQSQSSSTTVTSQSHVAAHVIGQWQTTTTTTKTPT